jgi:hypothetical protein
MVPKLRRKSGARLSVLFFILFLRRVLPAKSVLAYNSRDAFDTLQLTMSSEPKFTVSVQQSWGFST